VGFGGRYLSVALSVGLLRVAVSDHRDPLQFGLSSSFFKRMTRSPWRFAVLLASPEVWAADWWNQDLQGS
jgi:hypothetical protein